MKRYDMYVDDVEESPDGEWVRAVEAESECEALRASLHLEQKLSDELRAEAQNWTMACQEATLAHDAARAKVERLRALLDVCTANFDRMVEERGRANAADAEVERLREEKRLNDTMLDPHKERILRQSPDPAIRAMAHQPAAPSSDRCSGCGVSVPENGAHSCQPAAPARSEQDVFPGMPPAGWHL